MKWILLGLGVVGVLVWLERDYRRRLYWRGPHYVRQLREWYDRDAYGDEPSIGPMPLPPIVPLKAQPMDRAGRVRRRSEGR